MSPELQTTLALGIATLAVVFLLRSWFGKKKSPGCGGECGAVSPAIKEIQKRLRK
jgi:hypothetical protein